MDQAKEEIKVIAYFAFVHISRMTLLMGNLFFQSDCWCKKQHFVCLKRVKCSPVCPLCYAEQPGAAAWGGCAQLCSGEAGTGTGEQLAAPWHTTSALLSVLTVGLCPQGWWGGEEQSRHES